MHPLLPPPATSPNMPTVSHYRRPGPAARGHRATRASGTGRRLARDRAGRLLILTKAGWSPAPVAGWLAGAGGRTAGHGAQKHLSLALCSIGPYQGLFRAAALPAEWRRSLAFANGTEFVRHRRTNFKQIRAAGIRTYCGAVKSPWPKGGAANAIGWRRRFLPRRPERLGAAAGVGGGGGNPGVP